MKSTISTTILSFLALTLSLASYAGDGEATQDLISNCTALSKSTQNSLPCESHRQRISEPQLSSIAVPDSQKPSTSIPTLESLREFDKKSNKDSLANKKYEGWRQQSAVAFLQEQGFFNFASQNGELPDAFKSEFSRRSSICHIGGSCTTVTESDCSKFGGTFCGAAACDPSTGCAAGNNAPTDIALSATSINDSSTGTNATVATASTTDADGGDSHTYSLVSNGASGSGSCGSSGDDNNSSFNFSGSTLRTASSLSAGSYNICIQTNDSSDTFQKTFAITVASTAPTVTSATYDSSTGVLAVTGTNFEAKAGAANDVTVSNLTITGEGGGGCGGGSAYTLTGSEVEITSATEFSVTLTGTDKLRVDALLNKNLTAADDGTTYNLAAADDFIANVTAGNTADATNAITVSNYANPAITSSTYDASTGALEVTGSGFSAINGGTNDVVANTFTLTGDGGSTYTLTDTANVDVTNGTTFTLILSATDKFNVNGILNANGSNAASGQAYNLAAADNWMAGGPTNVNIADAAATINTSNVTAPAITSADYNRGTGVLTVTGTNFVAKVGGINDVDTTKLTLTGEGGGTHTLTSANVDISSATSFSITFGAADRLVVNGLLNKNGTQADDGATNYNLNAADRYMLATDSASSIADTTNTVTVSNTVAPTVTSAAYNASSGALVVTAVGMARKTGVTNDIDVSKLSLLGEGNNSYTLTSNSVDISNETAFTVVLNDADKININGLLNKDGTTSGDNTTYNLAAAEDWQGGIGSSVTIADLTVNGVTVSNTQVPAISSATYDFNTGVLAVTGTNMVKKPGVTNDVDLTKLTLTGLGSGTRTLTTTNVEITDATSFSVTLNSADKTQVNALLDINGTQASDSVTYNLNAAEDWMAGAAASVNVVDATGNGVTVSNVPVPTITSATYNSSTGVLVVTGTDFEAKAGAANDVTANTFTLTGEAGGTYTLTDTADVEITNATSFSLTLSATDKLSVDALLNKDGLSADNGTAYNLAVADDFIANVTAGDTADATGNTINVSNYSNPTVSSATYDFSTGDLVVTGTGFSAVSGATNDVDPTKLTLTGDGGGTYNLTSTSVDVTNATTFTITLNAADKLVVGGLLNKDGTTSGSGTTYNLAAADNWMAGGATSVDIADLTSNGATVSNVTAPVITSATYDFSSGALVVAGTNFVGEIGATNDVVVSNLTLTGDDGGTYTLTGSGVEVASDTSFTVTLSDADRQNVGGLLNKNGLSSGSGTTYNLAAAGNWMAGADASVDIADLTGNSVNVGNVAAPTITSANYKASSGVFAVTGTNLVKELGNTNDVIVSALTLTGQGSGTHTLTTSNVELITATSFLVTLNTADKLAVNGLLNKDGTQSGDNTTYNIAAADKWMAGADTTVDIADATNAVTVSSTVVPAITSATYDVSTGALAVTGTGLVGAPGANNDIDVTKLTLTGESAGTYTLTSSNVDVSSDTAFSVTLNAVDQLAVNGLLNKNGTASGDNTNYNLAAAEDWLSGADASATIADATNAITVSNVVNPAVTSATYDASTGVMVVTGTGFVGSSGANNDVDISLLTITGENAATYTITSTTNVDVTSETAFSVTLSGADKTNVDGLLNKNGTTSDTAATTYNLAAADNWMVAADSSTDIAETTGNGITVSNVTVPAITSATYDGSTGVLALTGTNLRNVNGANNDVDISLLTITGDNGATYTITSASDVEITSATSVSVTLTGSDKTNVDGLLNKNGTTSDNSTTYNLAAADNWMPGVAATTDIADLTANPITVGNVTTPAITSATYNFATGLITVSGTNFRNLSGATNDVDVTKLSLTGEAGNSYTLTSTSVEITSATAFSVTLSETDKININGLLNKNGTQADDTTTYNVAAADNWMPSALAATDIADASSGVTVSNVVAPAITSITYDYATGTITVTGTNFVKKFGAANDVDISLFTFTGEDGQTYTITSVADIEITSSTSFTITLTGADLAAVNVLVTGNGTTAGSGTTYNIAVADNWMAGTAASTNIASSTTAFTASNVPVPVITSATYSAATGTLVVTGSDFQAKSGAANDISVSKLTLTGEASGTYTLTSADVEISSTTEFSVTLNSADALAVNGLLNKDGTNSDDSTAYNLAAADDFVANLTAGNTADATATVTVSNVTAPAITSANYNAGTGVLEVTGTNLVGKSGATNDIDISLLTFTGEAGGTYTLTSASDVEVTSATAFSVTLSGDDLLAVNGLLNKDGTTSDNATTYNLAAADNWATGAASSTDIADTTSNAITVSGVVVPAITSATYNATTGVLAITATGLVSNSGVNNDVDISLLTFTGESANTYTLTSTDNVEVTSTTAFSITLSGADKLAVDGLLNKNGTTSDSSSTTYNVAAADNWLAAAAASTDIVDATSPVTVSNVTVPAIASATYNATTGTLVVTGANFRSQSGSSNDVVVSSLTLTGQASGTRILTSDNVDVTSATEFSVTLNSADKTALAVILNKTGTAAVDATTYNLAAADNWMAGAAATTNIADSSAGVTVSNLEAATVTLSAGDSTIAEAAGTSVLTATLSRLVDTGEAVTVTLGYSGTAVNSADFNGATTITIASGQLSGTTTVTAVGDTAVEVTETIVVDITNVSTSGSDSATENGTQQQTINITDDDVAVVTLAVNNATMSETSGTSTVTATLDKATYENVVVSLGYTGTAVSGTDYVTPAGSITITAGQTSGSTTLTASADTSVEADETIIVDITGVTGGKASESGSQQQTVTITDDDNSLVTLSVNNSNMSETGGTSTITATLDKASFENVVVSLGYTGTAASGTDYATPAGSITIVAGQTTGTATLTATSDGDVEDEETIIVDITGVTGGKASESAIQQQTVTIADDDTATVSMIVSTNSISEASGSSTVTVTLDKPTFENVVVSLGYTGTAVSGTDYATPASSITITAGQTAGTATLTATSDADVEADETIIVDITGVSGGKVTESGTQQQTVTITDDDTALVTLSVDNSAMSETGGTSTVTATLDKASFENVVVSLGYTGTAVSGTDYATPAGSITITAGQTTGTATLTATADDDVEGDETIVVDITGVSGGKASESGAQQQTVTITDNDAADGSVIASSVVVEPVAIPSTANSSSAVAIFDFSIVDGGSLDNKPLNISQIVINVSGTIDASKLVYLLNGNDATNVTGTYLASANTITFSGLSVSVANGTNETYTLSAYYSDNTGLTEGQTLILSTDGDNDFTVDSANTQMATTNPVNNGTGSTASITATQLVFTTQPAGSVSGIALSTQPVIQARDAARNLDTDFTEVVTLTEASAGTVSNATATAVAGVATFSGFTYTASADNEAVTITANDVDGTGSDLPAVNATAISSNVVATRVVFATQPAPLAVVSGVETSFTTVPVLTAVDANGTTDVDYSVNLVISQVNGAGTVSFNGISDLDIEASTFTTEFISGSSSLTDVAFTYTAAGNGNETFNLQATSGSVSAATSDVFTVNDGPGITGVPTSFTVIEDVASEFDLSAVTLSDTDGDALTLTLTVASGTLSSTDGNITIAGATIAGSGSATMTLAGSAANINTYLDDATKVTYSPVANDDTSTTLTITANDGEVDSAASVVQVGITPVNDPPTIDQGSIVSVSMSEDSSPIDFSLTLSASDIESSSITWSVDTQPGNGTATVDENGVVDYTPNADFTGIDTFVIDASDGGLSDTTTVEVTVSAINDAPVISQGTSTFVTMSEDSSPVDFALALTATDVEGSTIIWTVGSAATNGTASVNANGVVDYTPNSNFSGSDSFLISASDGSLSDSITVFVTVQGVNDAPVIDQGTSVSVTMSEDSSPTDFSLALSASDTEGSNISWSVSSSASSGSASVSTSGVVDYSPNANFNGSDSFVVTASDGAASDAITVNVTVQAVNDVPVIDQGASVSVTMSEDSTPTDFSLTLTASDVESSPITWSVSSDASNGGASVNGNGVVEYTPNANFSGSDSFVVTASDGDLSDSITVQVTVSPVNDAPVIDQGESATVSMSEDSTPVDFALALTATDTEEATIVWSVSTDATIGAATIDSSGVVDYVPNANVNGSDSFVVTASDGDLSDTITVQVTVEAVNDAPVISGTPVTSIIAGNAYNFAPEAADVDVGDSLTFSASLLPAFLSIDSATGVVSGSTTRDNIGTYENIVISVSDGTDSASLSAFTLTVQDSNVAPIIEQGESTIVTMSEDGSPAAFALALTATDENGNTLTWSVDDMATLGTASVDQTGVVSYVPDANANGSDSFNVTVSDSIASDTIAVTVIIEAVNDAPVISGEPTTAVNIDSPYSFVPEATDIEEDTLTFEINAVPTWATFDSQTGALTGTPTGNDIGTTDPIIMSVSDGEATASLEAFTIIVFDPSVNIAPTVTDTAATTEEDVAVEITLLGEDVNGDTLTYSVVTAPANGDVAIVGNVATYTPVADFNGQDSFTYLASDGVLDSDTAATVTITVTPVNDAPEISGEPASRVASGSEYLFEPAASDVDGDSLVFTQQNLPVWLSIDSASGALTGTPTDSDIATFENIIITVSDGSLSNSLPAFTITVVDPNANTAPVAQDSVVSTNEDTPVSITLLATDENGDDLTYRIDTSPALGTIEQTGNVVTYTPNLNAGDVQDSLTFIANDGIVDSNLATVTISIAAVNDAPVISGNPATTVKVGQIYSFTPQFSDIDSTSLTLTSRNLPRWATFDAADGSVSGTPGASDVTTYSDVTIEVSDGELTDALVFSITVQENVPPQISGENQQQVQVGESYRFTPGIVNSDNDTLTFSIENPPTWASFVFDSATGTMTGQPTAADIGTTSGISITVSDGISSANLPLNDITVCEICDPEAPVIGGSPVTSILEGQPYRFVPSASDANNDIVSFGIVNQPSWASFDTATGTLSGTAVTGTYTNIQISVTDSTDLSSSLPAFSISVTAINNPPVVTGTPPSSVDQNAAYRFIPSSVSDPDGDTVEFSLRNNPAWLIVNRFSGSLSGTPGASDVGTTSGIELVATDGVDHTIVGPFSITVNAFNTPPVFTNTTPRNSVAAGTGYSFSFSATDVDADDVLSFAVTGQPEWLSMDSTAGILSGTAPADFSGVTTQITVSVSDGTNTVNYPGFTINVNAVNSAPVASNVERTGDEDSVILVAASVIDADNDIVTITTLSQPASGTLVELAGGWQYTPATNFNGTDSFTYEASDAGATSDVATVTMSVTPVNDDPVATDDNLSLVQNADGSYVLDVLANDTDVDGNALNISLITANLSNVTMGVNGSNQIVLTAPNQFTGNIAFNYSISDGDSGSDSANVNVVIQPNDTFAQPPTINGINEINVDAIALQTAVNLGTVTATDASGNDVAVEITGSTATDINQRIFRPGSNTVTWNAVDDFGNQATEVQTVNVRPLVSFSENETVEEGTEVDIIVTLNGDAVQYPYTVNYSVSGTADGADHDLADGTVTFTDDTRTGKTQQTLSFSIIQDNVAETEETIVLTLAATDNPGESADVTMTISEQNQPPRIVATTGYSVLDNLGNNPGAGFGFFNTFNQVNVESGAAQGYSLGAAGLVFLTTDTTSTNTTVVINTLEVETFSWDINWQRSPFPFFNPTFTAVLRGSPVSYDFDALSGSIYFNTIPNGILTNLSGFGRFTANSFTGSLIFVPYAEIQRAFFGAFAPRGPDALVAKVGQNEVDLISADSFTVDSDTQQPLTNTANLRLTLDAGQQGTLPTDEDSDGDQIPDSEEGFSDTDNDGIPDYLDAVSECNVLPHNVENQTLFVAEADSDVCLQLGDIARANQIVGIRIDNAPTPLLAPDENITNVGGSVDFIMTDLPQAGVSPDIVIGQVTPIPGNAIFRIYREQNAQWRDFSVNDNNDLFSAAGAEGICPPPGSALYTPGLTEGDWCVMLRVEDGGANDNDRNVDSSIFITGGVGVALNNNQLPVAEDDLVEVAFNTATVIDVLANDADPDGDVLTVTRATGNFGSVMINSDSTLLYEPNNGYVGTDVVSYLLNDGNGGTASANVAVTITANRAPGLLPDSVSITDTESIEIDVLANDVDIDGDALTIIDATSETGAVSITENNTLFYVPIAGFSGIDILTYTVQDTADNTSSTTVSVMVDGNLAPVADDDAVTTAFGTSVTIDVLSNDSDPDGDALTIMSANADRGEVTITEGSLLFIPLEGFSGDAIITYTISDGLLSADGSVTVTVLPEPVAPVTPSVPVSVNNQSGGGSVNGLWLLVTLMIAWRRRQMAIRWLHSHR